MEHFSQCELCGREDGKCENGCVFATLLVDGAAGIYVPRAFARNFEMGAWGVKDEDAAVLLGGPDEEYYWDTWDEVLNYAEHTDKRGNVFRLNQNDGDLWAILVESD